MAGLFKAFIYSLRSSPLRPNLFFLTMVATHNLYKREAEKEEEGRVEEMGDRERGR